MSRPVLKMLQYMLRHLLYSHYCNIKQSDFWREWAEEKCRDRMERKVQVSTLMWAGIWQGRVRELWVMRHNDCVCVYVVIDRHFSRCGGMCFCCCSCSKTDRQTVVHRPVGFRGRWAGTRWSCVCVWVTPTCGETEQCQPPGPGEHYSPSTSPFDAHTYK